LDEGPGPAGRKVMDRPRDELLAGPGLTRDEHCDVDPGRFADDLARVQHLAAAPEVHLFPDSSRDLLGGRSVRFGLRTDQVVEGLEGLAGGRNGCALIAPGSQEAEESELGRRVTFDYERFAFSYRIVQGESTRGKPHTKRGLSPRGGPMLLIFHTNFFSEIHATSFKVGDPMWVVRDLV